MTSEKRLSLSETHKLPSVPSGAEHSGAELSGAELSGAKLSGAELPSAESYRNYLEAVCNNATVSLFIMDEQQHCVYMNAAAERMTGYRLAEVQGRALHDVIHHTRPDGRPYPLCECPIDRAFPQNNQEQGEEVFVHKDGHFYPVAYTASPIRQANGIVGTVIEVRDITQEKQNERARRAAAEALRQSEERFRQFSENAKDVFWITDLRTPRLLYINSAYERVWQRSCEELYQNYDWLDTIHPDDCDRVRSAVLGALSEGYEIEYRIVRPDGSIRWIRDRGFALPEANGEPYRMAGIAEDITDRKSAEFERQRLTTLIENSEDFIGIATLDGQAVYVNRAGQALVGLQDLDAVRQTRMLDYFLPTDQIALQDVILPYLMQRGSWRGEIRLRHFQTGALIPVDYSLFVVSDPQTNEPIGLATITRDITLQKQLEAERKQAEQEREQLLQQAEASLRQLEATLNTMGEGIIVADSQGNILRFNPAALALHGYESLEAVQHHFSQLPQLFDVRDAEGHPLPLEAWPLARVLRGETMDNLELTIRRRDTGKTFIGSYSGSPVYDAEGQITLAIVTLRDITLQKQAQADLVRSEAKFRQMTDLLPQIIWTADPDGTIDYYNQYWEDYTGISRTAPSEAVWREVVHPADQQRVIDRWSRSIREKVFLHECEHRNKNRAGEYRWHLTRAVPQRNEQGQIIKWFGTTIDIHEQKLAIDARSNALMREQAAREEAEQANRIKDEFLAVLSHELRSPLNPILGWTRLLLGGKLDPARQTEALKTIERNAKLQTQLIDDLLDISRILRGKLPLTSAAVSLPFVITAAVETVRLAAEAKQIEVRLDLNSSVPPVWGDAARLQQVVWNLLSNAVKFTPSGGRVTVRLEQGEGVDGWMGGWVNEQKDGQKDGRTNERGNQQPLEASEALNSTAFASPTDSPISTPIYPSTHPPLFARLTVTDTGKGISPQFLPYVFDYFRQEDGTITRQFGGLGLGLAIARQLVELHGGRIRVESPGEGQGATFIVQLPTMATSAAIAPETAATEPEDAASPLDNLQILLVDDDSDTREFEAFVLEQGGARVIAVASGSAALQTLQQFTPDVLVSDIGMPEMDGYALMQQIRTQFADRRLPGIALTAYAREFDQQMAFESGFEAHLAKPVEPEMLVSTIVRLVNR